jgi:phospholipase/carboxylesterase
VPVLRFYASCHTRATPTLHGAGGDARSGISDVLDLADEAGLILLAPESRGRSWDVLVGGYGPDVVFIDRSLGQTFDRLAVDAEKVAVVGFSDGASYALSLGPTNGDLFTRVIAFSPGFASPGARRGMPPVFVSHGTRDGVSPIERCSRRIVPRLEREGYEVRYREFDGPHTVSRSIARGSWVGRRILRYGRRGRPIGGPVSIVAPTSAPSKAPCRVGRLRLS